MSNFIKKLTGTIAIAIVSVVSFANAASAMPLIDGLATKNAASSLVEPVRWRGRGWGVGAGFVGGAIIGGALAAPYYYGPGYYPGPYYGNPYYPAAAYYGPPGPGGAMTYCMQRFRSYDPRSGTYLGNDGFRHRCP